MKVICLRHFESEFNERPSCTDKNVGLSKRGDKYSIKFSETFDLVILSPLLRCIQTFQQCHVKYNDLYVWNEVREFMKDPCDFFTHECMTIETYETFSARVDVLIEKLKQLKQQNPNIHRVLLVSHSDLICELTGVVMNNGEITEIDL
jgi:broad specificity phosphatase PhoE